MSSTSTTFASELSDLIQRHVDQDVSAEDLVDELARQKNLVFGRYNVAYRLNAPE